jgi:hypothetical protein
LFGKSIVIDLRNPFIPVTEERYGDDYCEENSYGNT